MTPIITISGSYHLEIFNEDFIVLQNKLRTESK